MSIEVKDLNHFYNKGTSLEKHALDDVNFVIDKGEFVLIGGEVGSGKSTLVRHFNGLLKPDSGSVKINDIDAGDKKVRSHLGLLMQNPQKQLFGRTVFEDISFGPSNFGSKGEALKKRVVDALDLVGLGPEYTEISPFSLSGGQMRLVALAGILAMEPEYLVLDEPTSGLDPENRYSLLSTLKGLHCSGLSVVVVSHQVDEILPLADKVILLKKGRLAFVGTPEEYLSSVSSPLPEITSFMKLLNQAGFDVRDNIYSVDDAFQEIVRSLKIVEVEQNE